MSIPATDPAEVLFSRHQLPHGALGLITLNRPRALNALSPAMVDGILEQLPLWLADPNLTETMVIGAGEKGLCAGGDVKAVCLALRAEKNLAEAERIAAAFLHDEYRMNALMAEQRKPYTALMNGVCMGGGMGVAISANQRIVSDNTMIAMPESAIGFIPDVGATHFLSRLPHKVGLYLGMSGARISAADALALGLATHYVPQTQLDAFKAMCLQDGTKPALARFAEPAQALGAADITQHYDWIESCFSQPSAVTIMRALAASDNPAAQATYASMQTRSPASMELARALQAAGKDLDFKACLQLEFNASQFLLSPHRDQRSDFFEGIRAVLIDKDHAPNWNPARLEDLPQDFAQTALSYPAKRIDFLA